MRPKKIFEEIMAKLSDLMKYMSLRTWQFRANPAGQTDPQTHAILTLFRPRGKEPVFKATGEKLLILRSDLQ